MDETVSARSGDFPERRDIVGARAGEVDEELIDLVTAALRESTSLLNHAEMDFTTTARRISAVLSKASHSNVAVRSLFKLALIEETPQRSRFVADVLISQGHRWLARLLAEHAMPSAAKAWQKRRLKSLVHEEVLAPSASGASAAYRIVVGHAGVESFIGGGGEARLSVGEPDVASRDWFALLVEMLELEPVSVHRDVLVVELSSASVDTIAVLEVLRDVQLLPVIPIIAASAPNLAATLMADLTTDLVSRVAPVVVCANDDGAYTLVTAGGGPLYQTSTVASSIIGNERELLAIGAGAGLLTAVSSPILRQHLAAVVDAFRRESGALFSLRTDARALARAMLFQGSYKETAGLRSELIRGLLESGFNLEALSLLESVPKQHRDRDHRSHLVEALFGVGEFEKVAEFFEARGLFEADKRYVRTSVAASSMLDELSTLLAQGPRESVERQENKVLSILHASVPDQSGGYAVRAHSILQEIDRSAFSVVAYTRPGFPEVSNRLEMGDSADASHGGVKYRRLGSGSRRVRDENVYMAESVEHYKAVIRHERPAVVHLRSTYVSALPGLIAAKHFGLPAVYEVSGMWELVYAAANTGVMEGRRARTVRLENAVLAGADSVVTITEAMGRIISDRVTLRRPVSIVPNAVDTTEFVQRNKNTTLLDKLGWDADVPVIGYVGSFVDYEGLDSLIIALAMIRDQGVPFRALLVGDGAEGRRIRDLARRLELSETQVHFTGRVPHEEVSRFYSLIDVCAYPRRLTPATEAVSPLKPFEAMASRKAVIVSDVPALVEIAGQGTRAIVVPHDSPTALAASLSKLALDLDSAEDMRARAESWVRRERSWDFVGGLLTDRFQEVLSDARADSPRGTGVR